MFAGLQPLIVSKLAALNGKNSGRRLQTACHFAFRFAKKRGAKAAKGFTL